MPRVTLAPWPEDRPFALFLSHDMDQFHDRERCCVEANGNPIQPLAGVGLRNSRFACRGDASSSLRSEPAWKNLATLLALEGGHGFRSTYFLQHDDCEAGQEGLFLFKREATRTITRMIQDAGGELGVHGGDARFNNAARYRQSIEELESNFGVRPCGIRNHSLRFSYPETWRAQAEAGFAYDATYGLPGELGPRGGWPFPFQTCDASAGRLLDLYELPVTVWDATLFRHLHLAGEAALDKAWETVQDVVRVGGLVSLLWHNYAFAAPEYWDWQRAYEELLRRLAPLKPWCATGVEINAWARGRAAVQIGSGPIRSDGKLVQLTSPLALHKPVFEIEARRVTVHHPQAQVLTCGDKVRVQFNTCAAGETILVEVHA